MDLLQIITDTMNKNNVSEKLADTAMKQTPNNTNAISQVMEKVLPLFNQSLKDNASEPAGLSSLLGAIAKKHTGGLLDKDIKSLDENALQQDGQKILQHIFGNSKDNVIQQVSQETHQDSNIVGSIISMLAPFVLDSIGKNMTDILDSNFLMKLSSSFLDNNKDGSIQDDLINMGKKFFS